MCGSNPEAEVVTRSIGTGLPGLSAWAVATSPFTRSINFWFVGPRFDPAELAASYPLPAAEGREGKYDAPEKPCPIMLEPTILPSFWISRPLALWGKRA